MMKLLYPKEKKTWDRNKLPSIPSRHGDESNALMIAAGQNNFDLYVCFTALGQKEVWIEKASVLNTTAANLTFEMLVAIEDDKEFTMAHQFFIDEGFLEI